MSETAHQPEQLPRSDDVVALQQAFEQFMRSTASLEAAYGQLQGRVATLDSELEVKNRALAATTEYLNSILEGMSDGVIAIDNDGVVTTYNRAAESILGYPAASVLGEEYTAVFAQPFGGPERLSAVELRTHAGATVPITQRISPIAGSDGRQIGLVKVFQDLSEIEFLREQVRRKDRLAALGEMAATVAHEIRNPLGGVRGFAALLERDLAGNEEALRLVEKILAGTRNLDRVVNELLEYTRPIELRKSTCSISELLEAAAGLAGIDARHVEISHEVHSAPPVFADADRLRQVFLNILLNASQAGGVPAKIHVDAAHKGRDLMLRISDNGAGISPEHLERIFSPFFTTKEKGTGLGLAVAAKVVESHGGQLTAESNPGHGATFVIRLPLEGDSK